MISQPYVGGVTPTPIRRKQLAKTLDSSLEDTGISLDENMDLIGAEETADEEEAKKAKRKAMLATGLKALPFALDTVVSYSKQVDQNARLQNQLRKQSQQTPIWDYNSMYGDNQPIIKAKNGAEVRSSSSESLPFKIDDGEFLMLPDGKLEHVKGSSNKTDDVSTILPHGTKIFSNTLKPVNSKDTFAKLAKKHDYTDELTKLENPYTTPVSRTSAERMLQRKQKSLLTLFDEQQALNGDSIGEVENVAGGVSGPKPIYVNSKSDPRYKAYNDSMTLYNNTKGHIDKLKGLEAEFPESAGTSANRWFEFSREWASLKGTQTQKSYDRLSKYNSKKPEPAKTFVARDDDSIAEEYKKPVQPVKYKKPEPIVETSTLTTEVKMTPKVVTKTVTPITTSKPTAASARLINNKSNNFKAQVEITNEDGTTSLISPAEYDTWAKTHKHEKHFKDGGHWIQDAVNPKHRGFCSPMTKSTCTPHRKALARTFKKHHGFHHEMGGEIYYKEGGIFDIDEKEYKRLLKEGHQLEIIE